MPQVPLDTLTGLVVDVFVRNGTSPGNAAILARTVVSAEADGAASHGLFRLPGYVDSLKSGWVDGVASPVVEADGSIIRVDACNGFAQPALGAASPDAIATVRRQGVCVIAIRESHHFGALWSDVEPFAREGLVALSFVNSITRVVPWGGHSPVYGTNPMAFAVPRATADPMVVDQSSSAMAFGDVKLAAKAGHPLPEGAGVDRHGQPTTDAASVVDGGALLPFGGHKGSSIAMLVELLCAGLTGGNFSFEVDLSGHPGAQTPRTGQTLILIDPSRTTTRDFVERAECLFGRLAEAGQTRLPGDRRYANRRRAEVDGVSVDDATLQMLDRLTQG
jgi:delta1-piperideine-2-carboxylate reductase